MTTYNVKASTQYGDLKGTVSLDGFNGPFLHELMTRAKIPSGFVPVGLSLYVGEPGPGSMHNSQTPLLERPCVVSIYASDKIDNLSGDAVAKYVSEHPSVHASSFDTEVSLEEFFAMVKRFKLVAKSRLLKGVKMRSGNGE